MKKISVVIPVYNSSKSLQRCFDSILLQIYQNYEVIVVDDGSEDDSRRIEDEYNIKYSKFHIYKIPNGGVSHARNYGIQKSTGECIVFIDSDDYVEADYLERLVSLYDQDYLIICNYNYVVKNDIIFHKPVSFNDYGIEKFGFDKLIELKLNNYLNVPWNKLYDLTIIKSNSLMFDENKSLGEDLLFNIEYLKRVNKGVIFINESLINYDVSNTNSLSNKFPLNFIQLEEEEMQTIDFLLNMKEIVYDDLYYVLKGNYVSSIISFCWYNGLNSKTNITNGRWNISKILKCKIVSFKIKLKICLGIFFPNTMCLLKKRKES
ncbi:MAG: glycosyltransferase family 2 protein [Bacilli bacterium]